MISECDGQSICLSKRHKQDLKRLLARAINKNQILILNQVQTNSSSSITTALSKISRRERIPLSTLKLNAKILKELNLIDFGNIEEIKEPELTEVGRFVLEIVGGDPE